MAIVYLHRRTDNKKVFYVGIGLRKGRAFETKPSRRNYLWNKIYNELGVDVEITHTNICWEEACKIEQYLISFYKDQYSYLLCNLTDGGDGTLGVKVSEDRKSRYSNMYKGIKRTEDDKQKMRKPKLNGTNSLKGKKLSEEHKLKLSLSHKGKRKPLSEEHKLKISLKRKGVTFSKEHKDKIAKSNSKRVVSEETKLKMRLSHLGKTYVKKT